MPNITPIAALATVLAAGLSFPGVGAADSHWAEFWPERPLSTVEPVAAPRRGAISEDERAMAETAWRYFINNTQAGTGLVNAVEAYPSTTLWDAGSSLAAIVSAEGLGLIAETEAEERLGRLIATLGSLDLFRQDCPNKAYDTRTAVPTDYANQPGEIGCSAIDIARLLVWLRAAEQRFPSLETEVRAALPRWNWCGLVQGGTLFGAALGDGGSVAYLQEGRLGYEEYAARAFGLWGFDAGVALAPEPYSTVWMYGVEVPFDARDPRVLGAHNYVVTESYALWGIEFGFAETAADGVEGWVSRAAQNVYEAQARRHESTGILTARTEHQLGEAPFFVYDTVFSDGRPWATITDAGDWVPQHAAVAVKGALGLWALWETEYTNLLFDHVVGQSDPEKGYFEGVYEDGRGPIPVQSANNNGILLETLLFKVEGPILRPIADPADWARDLAEGQGRCLPRPAAP